MIIEFSVLDLLYSLSIYGNEHVKKILYRICSSLHYKRVARIRFVFSAIEL